MRKLLAASILMISTGFITPAMAGPVTINWDLSAGILTGGDTVGNSYTFSHGDHSLIARAYATTGSSNASPFEEARINLLPTGLGVSSAGEINAKGVNAKKAYPELDNDGEHELIVFEYQYIGEDQNHLFTGFQLGWIGTDSDLEVWVGGGSLASGYDFSGARFDSLTTLDLADLGFSKLDLFNDVPEDTFQSFVPGVTGPYLIIAPSTVSGSGAGSSGDGGGHDYVTISQISGTVTVEDDDITGPQAIPEPGTLLLSAIALLGLATVSRRRARQ